MGLTFANESSEYRQAREALLELEITRSSAPVSPARSTRPPRSCAAATRTARTTP